MNNYPAKNIFIRVDDLGRDADRDSFLLSEIEKYKLPSVLSIVPGWLSDESAAMLKSFVQNSEETMEIAQHGYQHKNHAPAHERKFEFGHSRTFAKQMKDIHKGQMLLRKHFNRYAKLFVPPHDRLNQDTLYILAQLDFEICIGSIRTFSNMEIPKKLKILSCQLDASVKVSNKRICRSAGEIEYLIQNTKEPLSGIMFHAAEFRSKNHCGEVIAMLSEIRQRDNNFIVSMKEL